MNQINAILKHFKEWHPNMGLQYLWDTCDGEMDSENYPEVIFEYDPDTAFFNALEILLKKGDCCLAYGDVTEDRALIGTVVKELPEKQLEMLKSVWVGKEEMDRMDRENDYLGWYFLVHCPYLLACRKYDSQGNFIEWCPTT